MSTSTIFAPATAPGRAGIAAVRVSGPESRSALRLLTRDAPLPASRVASLRRFFHPVTGAPIDEGLALWFPAPRSFTGEDVAELHVHGGRAVTAAMLSALAAVPGLRPAEAGEFSRRAFANGRMDLTQAEGLADLIDADTEAQRLQALRQMEGGLAQVCEAWRARLTGILARLEAYIDFPDEDIPADVFAAIERDAAALLALFRAHIADRRGAAIRDGFSVVIAGAPNAGKSSLLNALTRRETAIVSAVAGTTRDVIEVRLDLGGYAVTLCDTAGLRDSGDAVESEGIRRAREQAAAADLRLCLFDATALPALDPATLALADGRAAPVVTKVDLASPPETLSIGGQKPLAVSALTGAGISTLLARLEAYVAERAGSGTDAVFTRERHRVALLECAACLERFLAAATAPPELRAEDARLAARALGRITGAIDVEEILDSLFRQFCIGK